MHNEGQAIPCATWFTLSDDFSVYKHHSETFSNLKTHYMYKGEALNLKTLEPVKVGGKENCLYASAALTDVRSDSYPEATLFTSWGYYENDEFGSRGDTAGPGYSKMYWHEVVLDYMCLT